MRTAADRIRHTLMFELCGLMICTPLASLILHRPLHQIGALTICISFMAMVWNLVYNILFDRILIRMGRSVQDRPTGLRILHAICFEVGLHLVTIPIVAFSLKMNLLDAFFTDTGFALFFLVYAYFFNLIYDHLFPIPEDGIPAI